MANIFRKNRYSELQLESITLKPVVVVLVKTILDWIPGTISWCIILNLSQNLLMLHLIGKVPSVKLHLKNGFIQVLQLGQSKHLRQQFKPNRLKVDVLLNA